MKLILLAMVLSLCILVVQKCIITYRNRIGGLGSHLIASTCLDSWVEMGMNRDGFCCWLAKFTEKRNAFWMIVDRLMRSAHFLSLRTY
ncbi:hypothetical protein EPI10_021998 [Gossypium australe]|uniref:Secreted protein n=1 Tax=Gossypium australe TaxID=47621 RepID=A0A5B6WKE8_9ROSI|nr:hypothetical protein EPI10_021998 [Gossypium australe]